MVLLSLPPHSPGKTRRAERTVARDVPRPRQHLPKFCPSDDFCQGVTVPHAIGHQKIVGGRGKEAVGETTFDGP